MFRRGLNAMLEDYVSEYPEAMGRIAGIHKHSL
jgi:hypothetical protein